MQNSSNIVHNESRSVVVGMKEMKNSTDKDQFACSQDIYLTAMGRL